MVDYRKTGKYVQTPPQDPTDIYVGKPEEVDYSGKSTRIDDNFTYIASQIGGPEKYHAGTGLSLDTQSNTFSIDDSYIDTLIAATITDKQDALTPGSNIAIDENNVISIYGISQYQEATTEDAGLMSAEDKAKLDAIAENANNYVLPAATLESLGGIIVGDNLTIDNNGVLDAVNTTYEIAIPSANGYGGTAGLLSGPDKEKLDSVQLGANRVTTGNTNGYIVIDNSAVEVYRHPSYATITGIIPSGKLINGIDVDDTGHVIGISTTNESGINVVSSGVGNVVINCNYESLNRTLTTFKQYLGSIQIGVLDSSAVGNDPAVTDSLSTVLQKLRNNIAFINTNLSEKLDNKLEYKGTVTSIPSNVSNGDLYKVASSFYVDGNQVVNGDLIVYSNSGWVVIPSGEKADTWRPIQVEGTQVLSTEFNSGFINFKGTGNTSLIWDNTSNTLVIQTIGSSSGTGDTTYTAGNGLSESTVTEGEGEDVHYITTFSLNTATTTGLGGIKVGAGLNIDGNGVLSVTGTGYTANKGIQIVNNNIEPIYGTTANTISAGNHEHDLDDLTDVALSTLNENDVLTYKNGGWVNASPQGTTYSPGTGISISNNTISCTVSDTWRTVNVNGQSINNSVLSFIAGTGIELRTGTADGVTTVTIVNTGGSGPSPTPSEYVGVAPIVVSGTNISLQKSSEFAISEGNLVINEIAASKVTGLATVATTGSYNDLSNKPTITNTWRPVKYGTTTLDASSTTTLEFAAGDNTSLSFSNGVLTINSTDTNTTYKGTGGIVIDSSNNISIKLSRVGKNAATITNGSLYVKENKYTNGNGLDFTAETTTTDNIFSVKPKTGGHISVDSDGVYATYAAGNGLALSGDTFSVSVKDDPQALYSLGLDATDHSLYVEGPAPIWPLESTAGSIGLRYDGNTIKINDSGYIYVANTSALREPDAADVTLTLHNNTVYRLINSALASITISGVATDFSYCTLCFTSRSNTQWTVPQDWWCVGYDCTGGKFSPAADKKYQIAIDNLSQTITCYVLRLD